MWTVSGATLQRTQMRFVRTHGDDLLDFLGVTIKAEDSYGKSVIHIKKSRKAEKTTWKTERKINPLSAEGQGVDYKNGLIRV